MKENMTQPPAMAVVSDVTQLRSLAAYSRSRERRMVLLLTNRDLLREAQSETFGHDTEMILAEDLKLTKEDWAEIFEESRKIFSAWTQLTVKGEKVFETVLGIEGTSLLTIDASRYLSSHDGACPIIMSKQLILERFIQTFNPSALVLTSHLSEWDSLAERIFVRQGRLIECQSGIRWAQKVHSRGAGGQLRSPYLLLERLPMWTAPLLQLTRYWSHMVLAHIQMHDRLEVPERGLIIFTYNRKTLDVVIPLSKTFEEKCKQKPLVLVPIDSDAIQILRLNDIEYDFLERHIPILATVKATVAQFLLMSIYRRYSRLICFDGMEQHNSTHPAMELMRRHVDMTISWSGNTMRNIEAVKNVIQRHRAHLLFMPHFSENLVNSLAVGARGAGASVVELHRGTTGMSAEYSIFLGDLLFVGGELQKSVFARWGLDPNKIVVTGLPIFDELLEKIPDREAIKSRVITQLKIPAGSRVIVYLTQSLGTTLGAEERGSIIRMIYGTVKEMENIMLIVKLHPTEKEQEVYQNIALEMGLSNCRVVSADPSLDDVLLSSEIAITKDSTSGFNATIAGCRLAVVGYSSIGEAMQNQLVSSGIASVATSGSQLMQVLKSLLEESRLSLKPSQSAVHLIEENFGKLDRCSTKRMIEHILDLISTQSRPQK